MASLATVYLGWANSIMILFVQKRKPRTYLAREWCVWYDYGVHNTISVEKNDREISELHNI